MTLPGMLPSRDKQIETMELLGEKEVRFALADITKRPQFDERIASEWLRQKEDSRRDLLEIETLKTARDSADAAASNSLAADKAASAAVLAASAAREQARWAKWAAIIATVAAIIAAKDHLHEVIAKYL